MVRQSKKSISSFTLLGALAVSITFSMIGLPTPANANGETASEVIQEMAVIQVHLDNYSNLREKLRKNQDCTFKNGMIFASLRDYVTTRVAGRIDSLSFHAEARKASDSGFAKIAPELAKQRAVAIEFTHDKSKVCGEEQM